MPPPAFFGNQLRRFASYSVSHLNFYRTHLLFFTFSPLLFSGLLYAANGEFPVDYIDCLFNSVSAMTVCGLATVDLSGLTPVQQALLFLQMCLGSPVVVSWTMVYIRRSFFARNFQRIVESELARRARATQAQADVRPEPWWKRSWTLLTSPWATRMRSLGEDEVLEAKGARGRGRSQLRTDMIRRVEAAPQLVDPSGWISEGRPEPKGSDGSSPTAVAATSSSSSGDSSSEANTEGFEGEHKRERVQTSDEDAPEPGLPPTEAPYASATAPASGAAPILRSQTINRPRGPQMARTQTVEFAATPQPIAAERRLSAVLHGDDDEEDEIYQVNRRRRSTSRPAMRHTMSRPTVSRVSMSRPTLSRPTLARGPSMPRTGTILTSATQARAPSVRTMHKGFGGFPMPHELLSRLFGRAFPKLERKLTRTVTIPRTQTIASGRGGPGGAAAVGARAVQYISFEAVVGRNSVFRALTREQLEELGGVEYRALTALLWIVASYHIGLQLIAFTVIAPYMSIGRWKEDFVPPALHRPVAPTWFSGFQVVSSYTNTGMSLVDTSMVPFQQAYPMIVFMIILILAGNTAFPILLRFQIWVLSKIVPRRSRIAETLEFLLDHPRRCFVYLFPSHQTWFLVTVLFALNATDWFFFLVLDIGNPAMNSIPVGVRFIIGLLQATAVRAAGFGTISLSTLAPAVKVLYVLMMYVSVYPIAMSVRSTNVYEEKSLGVFTDEDEESVDDTFNPTGNRAAVWGRYLAMHARKQLSFDMWWLGLALFLVCIIERDGLDNETNASWFNIFAILFELVSAYGTVGLSLGLPTANYSFSGALRPLSKLIICAVMLRGRHRGLPVAIDRAVMLPSEYHDEDDADEYEPPQDEFRRYARSRSSTTTSRPEWRPNGDGAAEQPSAYMASGADHRDLSPSRGRDIVPRRPRKGSVRTVGPGAVRDVEKETERVVDDLVQRGGLMA